MEKDFMRLAKRTVANLPAGCIHPTEQQIFRAMNQAIAKDQERMMQLMANSDKLDQFAKVMSGMIKEVVGGK